jgi:4-amino-4-deoxy-L-arabinose transferase-like glycosyltransferase
MGVNKLGYKFGLGILLVLALSFSINIYGIWWGLPSFHGWAIDEITPRWVLLGVKTGMSFSGWDSRYPPIHFYLLTILYSPILLLDLILDKLNIIDINNLRILWEQRSVDSLVFSTYTAFFFLGRLLSVLMGTGTVLVVYLVGRGVYEQKAAVFAALITALICPFIYYSKTTNIEAPYIFWFVLSLLFYVRILKNHGMADYVWFSITGATAICTKDSILGAYVLSAVFVIASYCAYRKKQSKDVIGLSCIIDRKITLSLGLGVVLFLVYHNILFNWDGFIEHVRFNWGVSVTSDPGNKDNVRQLTKVYHTWTNLGFSFGWPIYFICLLGLVRAVWRRAENKLLLSLLIPAISYYLFYISLIRFEPWDRYILPITIILALFGGKCLSDFLNAGLRYPKANVALVALIFIYTFAYAFSVDVLMVQDSRYYVENWMKQNIDGKSSVLAIGDRQYLPRFEFQKFKPVIRAGKISLKELAGARYDYIVVTSDYGIKSLEEGIEGQELFSKLKGEGLGYRLALKYKSNPRWNFLGTIDWNVSNLQKINPEISIYRLSAGHTAS